MHSRAPLQTKKGTGYAKKGRFASDILKSGVGHVPPVSPVPTSMISMKFSMVQGIFVGQTLLRL